MRRSTFSSELGSVGAVSLCAARAQPTFVNNPFTVVADASEVIE